MPESPQSQPAHEQLRMFEGMDPRVLDVVAQDVRENLGHEEILVRKLTRANSGLAMKVLQHAEGMLQEGVPADRAYLSGVLEVLGSIVKVQDEATLPSLDELAVEADAADEEWSLDGVFEALLESRDLRMDESIITGMIDHQYNDATITNIFQKLRAEHPKKAHLIETLTIKLAADDENRQVEIKRVLVPLIVSLFDTEMAAERISVSQSIKRHPAGQDQIEPAPETEENTKRRKRRLGIGRMSAAMIALVAVRGSKKAKDDADV